MWELTVGAGGRMGGGRQRGKNWDNCNRITIKNNNKNILLHYITSFSYEIENIYIILQLK